MAVVKKNILGDVSGRVGDYIYRVRNGKVVKYRRPEKQRMSDSEAALSARKDFARVVKFATLVNSFAALKEIWKASDVPGTNHYQKIIKNNSLTVKEYGISARNIITPPGIKLIVSELLDKNEKIKFSIPINSSGLKKIFSQETIVHIIFYLDGALISSVPPFWFGGMEAELTPYKNVETLDIKIALDNEISRKLKCYGNAVVFIAASVKNPVSEKNYWTSTYANEFEIPLT